MNPRELLLASFNAALKAADPINILPKHLPAPPKGRTLVVGAGKAAATMAKTVENHWRPNAPISGTVITRYGHGLITREIEVIEAGHPIPDINGEAAAKKILESVKQLGPDDLLLALISGGGSSLLSLPADGIEITDLKKITDELLRSGAAIQEMNMVRKHLSAIHGGRLAAACKAPVVALIISDVTGDDPSSIASGPCAPDHSTYADAQAVLKKYGIAPSPNIQQHLAAGVQGKIPETPKPGDPVFKKVSNRIISTNLHALRAASDFFTAQKINTAILGDNVTGEAREVAKAYGALAQQVFVHNHPWIKPVALISGGETTVSVKGKGRGGRCTEFLLSLAISLNEVKNVYALACDTDGIDGSESNAGAILMPDSLQRAKELGFSAEHLLLQNDSYTFFEKLNDLVITGPTRTNVNDYRVILVLPA